MKTKTNALTRVSHFFLVSVALALICASLRDKWELANARTEYDILKCELQAAKQNHIPAAHDSVALAIRSLANSPKDFGEELLTLISRWGELTYHSEHLSRDAGVELELRVFHARNPLNSTVDGASHNTTIAILLDGFGEVIDVASYDSDLNKEHHSLLTGRQVVRLPGTDLASSPKDKNPHILLVRNAVSDAAGQDYVKIIISDRGFVQQTVSLAQMQLQLAELRENAEPRNPPKFR